MMQQVNHSNSDRYLITPSLLNSWAYIWLCAESVREAQSDTMCLEDKIEDKRKQAYQDFLKTLNREKSEPNIYMQRGIEFEEECYKGNTCISPIIQGGAYQVVGKKVKNIAGLDFLLYGRLDVLKGGVVYDIKRVSTYSPQKYINSYQHGFYLELFPRAYKFEYLVFDGKELHRETYYKDQVVYIDSVIENFINWLKQEKLLDLYKEKWRAN